VKMQFRDKYYGPWQGHEVALLKNLVEEAVEHPYLQNDVEYIVRTFNLECSRERRRTAGAIVARLDAILRGSPGWADPEYVNRIGYDRLRIVYRDIIRYDRSRHAAETAWVEKQRALYLQNGGRVPVGKKVFYSMDVDQETLNYAGLAEQLQLLETDSDVIWVSNMDPGYSDSETGKDRDPEYVFARTYARNGEGAPRRRENVASNPIQWILDRIDYKALSAAVDRLGRQALAEKLFAGEPILGSVPAVIHRLGTRAFMQQMTSALA